MSKEIDALVMIGYAHKVSGEAPHFLHEDTEQGLWYIENGHTHWYNGATITEKEKDNHYASQVFLDLGRLVVSRFVDFDPGYTKANRYRTAAISVIDALAPGELGLSFKDSYQNLQPNPYRFGSPGLIEAFGNIFDIKRLDKREIQEKWAIAQDIERRRGTVMLMAYNIDEIFEGIENLDMDEISPDTVEFNDRDEVTSESYSVRGLLDRAEVHTKPVEFSYYSTFRLENAAEMLTDALFDLRELKTELSKHA